MDQLIAPPSLWIVFILTTLIVLASLEAGRFLGKKHQKSEREDHEPLGTIVTALLGLLGFLLAFTFGITLSKLDERRSLVVEEANAISTTYLRANYIDETYRNNVRKLLKEYVSARIDAVLNRKTMEGLRIADQIQDKLWDETTKLAIAHPNEEVVSLFISSMNDVIDLHAKRVFVGLYIRLPFVIWMSLYVITLMAIGALGYQLGVTESRYRGISLLLVLIFACVITLVADLDRPQEGFIKVSQQSLIDLLDKFNKDMSRA